VGYVISGSAFSLRKQLKAVNSHGRCGVCGKQIELPTDRKNKGKRAYFEKSK